MTRGPAINQTLLRYRLKEARRILAEGGCLCDWCEVVGLKLVAGGVYLGRHAPHLRKALRYARAPRNQTPVAEALLRLRTVREAREAGDTLTSAAERVGIRLPTLHQWLKRWAPDGVDQAIEDLETESEQAEAA